MRFDNVYFINGTAYAGKSTLVKNLARRYHGIACEENYGAFLNSGFRVVLRDDNRTEEETIVLAEREPGLQKNCL